MSNKRYAWFDLTANLTFYGPGPGGKGQVFAHSTPILQHYKKDVMHQAILPDLAALVWSACQVGSGVISREWISGVYSGLGFDMCRYSDSDTHSLWPSQMSGGSVAVTVTVAFSTPL